MRRGITKRRDVMKRRKKRIRRSEKRRRGITNSSVRKKEDTMFKSVLMREKGMNSSFKG